METSLFDGSNLELLSKTALRVALETYGKTANLKKYQDEVLWDALENYKAENRRSLIIQRKRYLPTVAELDALTIKLEGILSIDYEQFVKIGKELSTSMQQYFTVTTFFKFPKELHGAINATKFLSYIHRSVDVERAMLDMYLCCNSVDSTFGYITEQELECFVQDRIPSLALLSAMHDTFKQFYICTVVRRWLFLLDPQLTGRINIKKLCHHQVMMEFYAFEHMADYQRTDSSADFDTYRQEIASNWYSLENAERIYHSYVALDKDNNGMLNEAEVLSYRGPLNDPVQLTPLVVSRIFQEYILYSPPEMDYKCFLDFVLAFENRNSESSLLYLWRILDIHKDGLLTPSTIRLFFRDVSAILLNTGYDACPSAEDVVIEVRDMVGGGIDMGVGVTLKQIMKSGQGYTIVSMLVDVNRFWQYDMRESLAAQAPDEEDPGAVESPAPPAAPSVPATRPTVSYDANDDEYDFY